MDVETVTDDASPQSSVSPISAKQWVIGTLSYTSFQLATLFCWILWGDFAWSMKDRSIGQVAQVVIKHFGASDTMMSLFLVSGPAAVGIILGPVISFKSDRYRSRWGRRIPFIAITTPFAVIAMVGLGVSGAIGRALHHLAIFHTVPINHIVLMVFGICWALFEISTVAANAVYNALVNDVVPHEVIGQFYGLFRALSLIAGILFNTFLFKFADHYYPIIFLGVGLFYGLGCATMCLMVKEGQYPAPDDVPPGSHLGVIKSARLYMKECFTNPFYKWLIGTMVVAALVFLPVNLYSIPFADSLHIGRGTYGYYLGLTYSISLCLAYPLGFLADRFHPLRVGIVTMFLYAAAMFWGGFHAAGTTLYAVIFIVHGVLSGCYFTGAASLGQRLFPRLRFAQFASAAGLFGAIANMVIAPILGNFLDMNHHEYHFTYHMGFGFAVLATLLLLTVHKQFQSLGGDHGYTPPG